MTTTGKPWALKSTTPCPLNELPGYWTDWWNAMVSPSGCGAITDQNSLARHCRIGAWIRGLLCTGLSRGSPPQRRTVQNAYIERFKGTFRREVLNANTFSNLAQVRRTVDAWLVEYNTERPHQALKFMTPVEYRQAA